MWNFSKPGLEACTLMKRQRVSVGDSGESQYKYVKDDPTGLGDVVTWGQLRNVLCESDSCSEDYDDSSSDSGDNDSSSEDENPTQIE